MSSWTAEIRRRAAEERRAEREELKRLKDLERRAKEREKLSAWDQARLEVEEYENKLEVLLSVHKEQSAPIEWARFASALPPHEPLRLGRNEFSAALKHGVASLTNAAESGSKAAEEARAIDEQEQQTAREDYARKLDEWERMRALAKRVLSGASGAYSEAITEFSSLSEIAGLGTSLNMTVHSPKLIECFLTVSGRKTVPTEMKSLTASGNLSVKAMPKARFYEIYQDYVCGCVLRLVREILALLPVDTVLVTASVNGTDTRSGQAAVLPVLSAMITRAAVEKLDFERLDPSDSMENFVHRGDVRASRKSGDFVPIIPLTPTDLMPTQPERMDFSGLLKSLRQLRAEIGSKLKPAASVDAASIPENSLSL